MRRVPLVLIVGLLALALAIDISVNPEGGSLDLEDRVRQAFALWQAVDDDLDVSIVENTSPRFAYGDAERFSPELASLTVTRLDRSDRSLALLFNPEAESLLERAVLHEAGIVLGLRPTETGVMSQQFTPQSSVELSQSDKDAFLALELYADEDLNQDGAVDFYDLMEMAKVFGRSILNSRADLNQDGVVDDADLTLLEAAYTFTEPAAQAPNQSEEDVANQVLPPVPPLSQEGGSPVKGVPPEGPSAPAEIPAPEENPEIDNEQDTSEGEAASEENAESDTSNSVSDSEEESTP